MKSVHRLGTVGLLLLSMACSGTEQAKDEAKDANKEVAEERKDVQAAAQKLAEEEGELREAELSADVKATKLENEITKDTASRRKP